MTRSSPIRFTKIQVDAFLTFSGDRNPLHCNEDYARRTPFGQIVVPGMCAVLTALSQWGQEHDRRIRRIRGSFKQPLFIDEQYRLDIENTGEEALIRLYKGHSVSTEITVSWPSALTDLPENLSNPGGARWPTTLGASYRKTDTGYSPDMAAQEAVRRIFDLQAAVVPPGQLGALAWASCFIGMEYPGTPALFSSFDLIFDPAAAENAILRFPEITGRVDERFRRATIEGSGGGMTRFELTAFVRPEPVEYTLADVARAFGGARPAFKDKNVFIAGGNRGFGGVLTRAFQVSGSRVMFTYHKGASEAKHIEAEAARQNQFVRAYRADLTFASECARVARQAAQACGTLDLVVHNAAPPIRAQPFLDQDPAEFSGFVERSTRMMSQVCYEFLPLMNPGGIVVCISSVYARQARDLFSHYICYKAAIEGLTRALGAEFKTLQFVIARPPRMATDQTNAPFSLDRVASAVPVAWRLLTHLEKLSPAQNVHEIDL